MIQVPNPVIGKKNFLVSKSFRRPLGPIQLPIHWVPGSLPRVKWPKRMFTTHLHIVPKFLRVYERSCRLRLIPMCFYGLDSGTLPVYFQPQRTLNLDLTILCSSYGLPIPHLSVNYVFSSENRVSGLSRSEEWQFLRDVSEEPIVPSSRIQESLNSWPLKMAQIGRPEPSVKN
jgi:hypothetical protein